jgi:uncharacterized protein YbcI
MSSLVSHDGKGSMDGVRPDASPAAGISRALVQLMARYCGRGPTKARTSLEPGHALVVLEDALTTGERGLVAAGEHELVRRQRAALQRLMQDDAIAAVEAATGRRVRLVMGDVAPEEGVVLQLFLFEAHADTG